MMICDTLASYLESLTLGIRGKSIFINMMPLECTQGILLRPEYGGIKYDWELPGFFKGDVRLVIRSNNYQSTQDLMNQVLAALPTQETQVGDAFVRYLRPKMQPEPFPVTRGNYYEAFTDLDICYSVEPGTN